MNPAKLQRLLQEAVTHHQAGRLDQARPLYDEVRRAFPKLFDPTHLAGLLALQQGRHTDALPLLLQATRLNPRSALAQMRLGATFNALGQAPEAERALRRATELDPKLPEAWAHLTHALRLAGKPADARVACAQHVRLQPTSIEARRHLATLTADLEGFAAAIPLLRELTERAPDDAISWCNLGLGLVTLGHLTEGLTALQRALALQPSLAPAQAGIGFALQNAHRIPEAIAAYDAALVLSPGLADVASARLLCLNYLDTLTADALFHEHRQAGARIEADRPLRADHPAAPPDRPRLRVAFLSPDLRAHSIAYFIEPLLRNLDPARFEIVLYHDHAKVDAVSQRLAGLATLWRNFAGVTPDRVEAQIRADAPDILVDLAGHTGFNRLPLYARRLAPVQISYLGYPNTTGLTTMDARLTDALCDPEGAADALHTERLVRFAPTAWAYAPPPAAPAEPPPIPVIANDATAVTFGSFNTPAKLSDATLRVWARLLDATPGSRLVLKGHGLDDPAVAPFLRARCSRAGISATQLHLMDRLPAAADHLAAYGLIDIALDPFPYAGTTTTCEALWQGRPVVTLRGDRHASRVGASLLTAIDRPEWIATSEDDYLRIATGLAAPENRAALHSHSQSLRAAMLASPLCDHAGQARRLADALEACWQRAATAVLA